VRVPLLKRVGAIAPQEVCSAGGIVRIDGVPSAAVLRRADRLGRALPSLQLCRHLERGQLFLLSVTNPASFDSRYFGPLNASTVIGVAHPVRLETRRWMAADCCASSCHPVCYSAGHRRVVARVVRRHGAARRATSDDAFPRAGIMP